jgi:predicted nucleic-acid-binding protein
VIAIDTNVLLRYLLADEPGQFVRAKKAIKGNAPVLVTDVALVETIWTLSGRRYGLEKPLICEVLRSLVSDACMAFESKQVVWASLRDYEEAKPVRGKHLDFADALIINKAKYLADTQGEALTAFFSFDRAVSQLEGAQSP